MVKSPLRGGLRSRNSTSAESAGAPVDGRKRRIANLSAAAAMIVGAELNAEMEHQTAVDSTTGPPQPLGERGARMADTVAAN